MDKITLKLSVQTYNTIIQALQEVPWKLANPALMEIEPQLRAALDEKLALTGDPGDPVKQ